MANKPYVVVEWNDTETDAKGWMCAYNFVGHYCGGGTRMHPTVTKEEVIRLATTMGYKYKACESPRQTHEWLATANSIFFYFLSF